MLAQAGKERADSSMEMALRLGGALEQFWDVRGHFSEGRAFLEKGLAASEGVDATVQAKALNTAASLAVLQGDIDHGERLAEKALALNKEIENPVGAGFSLYLLSQVAWTRGNFPAARALSEESLRLRREAGDKQGTGWSLINLAYLVSIQGEYTKGQVLFEESLALFRKLGNKEGIAWSLFNLARVLYISQADTTMVLSLLEEGLGLCRDLNN
jgi:tetratricopeptide (TPR) repeat protein